jgi:hypothetical protein
MIHAAESCVFLETFGDKLTMPVRTRSRLKHVLLENKFGKNFMEYKPFAVENVEFQYKGDRDNNNNSNSTNTKMNDENIYSNEKARGGTGKNTKNDTTAKIGLNILGRASLF